MLNSYDGVGLLCGFTLFFIAGYVLGHHAMKNKAIACIEKIKSYFANPKTLEDADDQLKVIVILDNYKEKINSKRILDL